MDFIKWQNLKGVHALDDYLFFLEVAVGAIWALLIWKSLKGYLLGGPQGALWKLFLFDFVAPHGHFQCGASIEKKKKWTQWKAQTDFSFQIASILQLLLQEPRINTLALAIRVLA